MKYLILTFLLSLTAYAMDASEARKISNENANKQVKLCTQQIIKDLNEYIPNEASRGGYVACTMADNCEYENSFLVAAHDHFAPLGYRVFHKDDSSVCIDWSK